MLKNICKEIIRSSLRFVSSLLVQLYAFKGQTIFIRPATTDLDVFASIFILGEFKLPSKFQPRHIIDAGAYTGISTLWFALKYPTAQIIAIEPENTNFAILEKNTIKYPNITRIKAGVWHKEAHLKIIDRGTGKWGFTVKEVSAQEPFDARGMTIEQIVANQNSDVIDLIKIDIEGAEKYLFESNSKQWLSKTNAVIVELHDRINLGCTEAVFKAFNLSEWNVSKSQEKVVFVRKLHE